MLNTMDIRNKESLQNSFKLNDNNGNEKKFENEKDIIEQLNRKKFGTIRHSIDSNSHS